MRIPNDGFIRLIIHIPTIMGRIKVAEFVCEELIDLKILPPNLKGFGDWEPAKSPDVIHKINKTDLFF